jgi:hypothetical protein
VDMFSLLMWVILTLVAVTLAAGDGEGFSSA